MKGNIAEKKVTTLLRCLAKHIGRNRAISMTALFEEVFQRKCEDKIGDTRGLRMLITDLRREGVPICSLTDKNGGGYYLAGAGSDLEGYCSRLRTRGLKILSMEAYLRNMTLPELIGQLSLSLSGGNGRIEGRG